jgi:L-alanine-DL-glutamate epimerase-like enolase superfamily enzyme
MHAADELAKSLLEDGFTGMKIWPFDPWALDIGGTRASAEAIRAGMEPFEKVRMACGPAMELFVELHSLWSLPAAQRICAALEPVDPVWIEDPVRRMDDVAAVAAVARGTRIPLAGGETLASRPIFRDLLHQDALSTVIVDLGWCGGLSEARRIAVLADSWARPVAPHDCSGPVSFAASVHLAMHASNAAFQECVRAFLRGWYRDTVTDIPRVEGGFVYPLPGPGLGTRLLPGFAGRPGAIVRRTTEEMLR